MPSDPRDYKVELSDAARAAAGDGAKPAVVPAGAPAVPAGAPAVPTCAPDPAAVAGRPSLSIHFACCGAYQRVYRSADGTRYAGRCPRCGKPFRFAVGDGGTTARSFTVR